MGTATDARAARAALEAGTTPPAEALAAIVELARGAPTRGQRTHAYGLLGDLAGRAFGAPWEVAERAAFALLELARVVDAPDERRALIVAMGRGFRNAWLLPYVHRRLSDADPETVAAAAIATPERISVSAVSAAAASRGSPWTNGTSRAAAPVEPMRPSAAIAASRSAAGASSVISSAIRARPPPR